jgi:hypothetical protein
MNKLSHNRLSVNLDDRVMYIIFFSSILLKIIGYGIVGITFGLQPIMKWACERLEGVWRVAAADLFLFLSFVGTVNVWRGVWHLLDDYFLPGN